MQGHLDKIKYCYYKLNQDVDFSIKADCECISVRPVISNMHQLIWTLLSFGKYRRFKLILKGEIVSTRTGGRVPVSRIIGVSNNQ